LAVVRIGLVPLGHHDRIPQKGPVDGGEGFEGTEGTNALLVVSWFGDALFPLGQVMFAQFAGIMDSEWNFAEESGMVLCSRNSPGRIIL